jgi:hypothetical protein
MLYRFLDGRQITTTLVQGTLHPVSTLDGIQMLQTSYMALLFLGVVMTSLHRKAIEQTHRSPVESRITA